GSGQTRFNPIHGADLATAIVDLVGDPTAMGGEYPMGGPDILTMREIGELAFQALGKPSRIRRFPAWTVSAMGTALKPFNVNVASLLLMFTMFTGDDASTDCYGDHHLADFFAELIAAAGGGPIAVR
ncbi:MAG: SDR family NAD(P)-dependent oxidoreductase, partial [Deltaproteobacteria bacterium]|nr:SDR family NAD(P)-dependent oxidoreductase [Deltaproteobacteria bacterium]